MAVYAWCECLRIITVCRKNIMGKSNRKGSENRQNHRSGSELRSDAAGASAKRRSWAAQSAHRASAGPMVDRREKRQGTRAERTARRVSEDREWD